MQAASQHGVLVAVDGCGILIRGPAGAGKSQLGLELLSRGHRLVADDLVTLRRVGDTVIGRGDAEAGEFLTLRCGLVIHVPRHFGAEALQPETAIDLCVSPGPPLTPYGPQPQVTLLERQIPQYFLGQLPGSAVCLEALARAWQLARDEGYSAADELAERQALRLLQESAT